MKVKYDEYIIKCTYKELRLIRSSLRTLEYDFKTHSYRLGERHTEVGKLIKKLHDIEKEHAEQYNKQTTTRNKKGVKKL